MSYDMAFQGVFLYPDAKAAKQALADLRDYEDADESVVSKDDVTLERNRIRVECFTSAPGMMWESSCGAIEALSERAIGGHVNAQYDSGDGEEFMFRIRFLPCGDSEDLDGAFPDGLAPVGTPPAAGEDLDGDLVMAALAGDEEKARGLLVRGANPERGLHGGVRDPKILSLLLAHGLVAKGDPTRQYSPLCGAARGGNAASIRLLVAAGASLEETDTLSAARPLMLAAEALHEDAVATLLELGADPNARDYKGNTALMHAVWLANEEVVAIARLLHQGGASTQVQNAAGETMWDRAERNLPAELFHALEKQLSRR